MEDSFQIFSTLGPCFRLLFTIDKIVDEYKVRKKKSSHSALCGLQPGSAEQMTGFFKPPQYKHAQKMPPLS
jgi:hypothetical protein